MIQINARYAYPLAPCACAGARCRYPDGSQRCWRCWSEQYEWERNHPDPFEYVDVPLCKCGTVIRNEDYDRCWNCRHQTVRSA